MKIIRDGYALPIRRSFADLLDSHLADKSGPVVLNFRDPQYSAENGGFHPVEVRVGADGRISYATDFSYVGTQFPELAKEMDFDFANGVFCHLGRDYPIGEGKQLFALFQQNFADYFAWGVFQVTVEEER